MSLLNRNEIIAYMRRLDLPICQYWITAGAGLTLYGIKNETADIDLGCTLDLFNALKERGWKLDRIKGYDRLVYDDIVEVTQEERVETTIIEGLSVASIESIKAEKIKLGREKDICDIDRIDAYLKKNKTR